MPVPDAAGLNGGAGLGGGADELDYGAGEGVGLPVGS